MVNLKLSKLTLNPLLDFPGCGWDELHKTESRSPYYNNYNNTVIIRVSSYSSDRFTILFSSNLLAKWRNQQAVPFH